MKPANYALTPDGELILLERVTHARFTEGPEYIVYETSYGRRVGFDEAQRIETRRRER